MTKNNQVQLNEAQSELLIGISAFLDHIADQIEQEPIPEWQARRMDNGGYVGKDARWDVFRHQAVRIHYSAILKRSIDESDSKRFQRAAKKLEKLGLIERIALYGVSRPSHFKMTESGIQIAQMLHVPPKSVDSPNSSLSDT